LLQSVLKSPDNAAFSLVGISGLPTIAPVLGVAGLQSYTLNSLYIAPLVAVDMTVTITPFKGAHTATHCCQMRLWTARATCLHKHQHVQWWKALRRPGN
jgi:hypothetical protein